MSSPHLEDQELATLYNKEWRPIKIALNNTKSRISLKQIHTVGEALKFIGVTDVSIWSTQFELNAKIDQPTFKRIAEIVENNFRFAFEERNKKASAYVEIDIDAAFKPLFHDSLIETAPSNDSLSLIDHAFGKQSAQAAGLREDDSQEHLVDKHLPPPNKKQTAILFPFQTRAAKTIFYGMVVLGHKSDLLLAGVGVGKTFIIGQVIRWVLDINFLKNKTFSPFAIAYVTKASIIEQTKRVLTNYFGLSTVTEVLVTNYDQLRSSFGELVLKKERFYADEEAHWKWIWRIGVHPAFFIWEEAQALKNENSSQSQIGQAVNDIPDIQYVYQLFSSATPFTRVSEAKCIAVATKLPWQFGLSKQPLSNEHWMDFAKKVADPADPYEHSPSAVERLMEYILPYVVDVKGVRPQFRAINKIEVINFQSSAEEHMYRIAWEKYLAEKAKLESSNAKNAKFLILVQFLKFRQAAELIRAPHIATAMYDSVMAGKAAIGAFNFKASIAKAVLTLNKKYGVPRQKISLIWGGDASLQGKKGRISQEEIFEIMTKVLRGEDVPKKKMKLLEKQAQNDANGMVDIPPELELGMQDKRQRQVEIDRFQSGQSLYCFYTFKSGGVGLSLHHCDELTKFKCRRKPSGYVYEEDIPKVPTRQREVYVAPTFSAIELVQGLGRGPRLTSLSDTTQTIIFYRGTIEEKVSLIVSRKLKCLKKVVRQRESWEDAIYEPHKYVDKTEQEDIEYIKKLTDSIDDSAKQEEESSIIDLRMTDDDEDDNGESEGEDEE